MDSIRADHIFEQSKPWYYNCTVHVSLFLFEQDINQDGFGDFVVGAPGVGNDAGSAYIIFGSEEYTAASYTLGSMGADDSFILNTPSNNGYGGFSVAGAGERNPSSIETSSHGYHIDFFAVKGTKYLSTVESDLVVVPCNGTPC